MTPFIVDTIREEIASIIGDAIGFIPDLFVLVVLLVLGYLLGTLVGRVVERVGRRVRLDEKIKGTLLGALFAEDEGSVSGAFALVAKWYIVLLALFAAAEHLGFTFLTDWLDRLLAYVPALIAGVLIIVVGVFVADRIGEVVRRSAGAEELGLSNALAGGTKAFLYFVVVVLGLATMGVDVTILETFALAFAGALGLALALAIGIAFGWGGKEYVAENIDEWLTDTRRSVEDEPGDSAASDA